MTSIFMVSRPDWYKPYVEGVHILCPQVELNRNFEDIRFRIGEIDRIAIMLGGFNYSGSSSNVIGLPDIVQILHKLKSELPILGWGFSTEKETRKENEIVLVATEYPLEQFCEITGLFFKKLLTPTNIPLPRIRKNDDLDPWEDIPEEEF